MHKKQFQNIVFLIFLVLTSLTSAQQIYVGIGLSRGAAFEDYKNSFGENTLNDDGFSKSIDPILEGGFRFNIYKQRLKMDFGVQYHEHQINTSFYAGNIRVPSTYNLDYVGLKTGFTFVILSWRKAIIQTHVHVSNDLLIFGTNRYKDEIVDIYKERTLNRNLFILHRGIGLEYKISDKISGYLNYTVTSGSSGVNEDSTNGERYTLGSSGMRVGLLFNISKKR